MLDGQRLVLLARGESRELQIDHAVARRGLPQRVEIGGRLDRLAGVGERRGQVDFRLAVGHVGQGGAQRFHRLIGPARAQGLFAAGLPALSQLNAMILEGAIEEQGESKQHGRDEEEGRE